MSLPAHASLLEPSLRCSDGYTRRLALGIEDPQDIIADLDRALTRAAR